MGERAAIDKLLSISSDATGETYPPLKAIGNDLHPLYERNGFFAFESALEVFPIGRSRNSYSLEEWNNRGLWISCYGSLAPEGLIFSQDLFGTQFILKDNINIFDPETGETAYFAEDVEGWADKILEDYESFTGQPLAHRWQEANGPLPRRSRLVPITPFVLGGAYAVENLIAMDGAAAMRLRASLALQISDLPEGAKVIYDIK